MASRGRAAGRKSRKVPGRVGGKVTGKLTSLRPPRDPVRSSIKLNDEEIARLVLETLQSIRTIERYAQGLPVLRTTKLRIDRAMAKLGIGRSERNPGAARRRVVTLAATG
jgi:hypothetical protein